MMSFQLTTFTTFWIFSYVLGPRLLFERSPHIMTQKQTQNWVLLSLSQLIKTGFSQNLGRPMAHRRVIYYPLEFELKNDK